MRPAKRARRPVLKPPAIIGIGEALRKIYPEDHECDDAMMRAIAKLDELTKKKEPKA